MLQVGIRDGSRCEFCWVNDIKFDSLLRTSNSSWGSLTVFGTFETAWDMRACGFIVLLLTCLWAFSLLGGQAALRALTLEANATKRLLPVQYVCSDVRTNFELLYYRFHFWIRLLETNGQYIVLVFLILPIS